MFRQMLNKIQTAVFVGEKTFISGAYRPSAEKDAAAYRIRCHRLKEGQWLSRGFVVKAIS